MSVDDCPTPQLLVIAGPSWRGVPRASVAAVGGCSWRACQSILGFACRVVSSYGILQFALWLNFATYSGTCNQGLLDLLVVFVGGSFALVCGYSSVCCTGCLLGRRCASVALSCKHVQSMYYLAESVCLGIYTPTPLAAAHHAL